MNHILVAVLAALLLALAIGGPILAIALVLLDNWLAGYEDLPARQE